MKQTGLDRFFSGTVSAKIAPSDIPKITNESPHRLYFDGCSKGNPGAAGAGAVLYEVCKNNVTEIWADSCFVGSSSTNNEAEYSGLILGMKQAIRKGICDIDIYGDSQLVIKQMRGEYAVKSLGLSQLYAQAKELEKAFTKVRYIHVYRHLNTRADELSNLGLLRKN